MSKLRLLAAALLIVAVLVLGVPMAAGAQFNSAFWCEVYVDGAPAGAGLAVQGLVGGVPRGDPVLTGSPPVTVDNECILILPGSPADIGADVSFTVDGLPATETPDVAYSLAPQEVRLDVTTGPPPPECDDWFPAHGATDVPRDVVVGVHFTKDMNPATIDETTFLLDGVAGVVDYTGATRWASFTPDVPLDSLTEYTVTIGTGALDVSGNGMAAP